MAMVAVDGAARGPNSTQEGLHLPVLHVYVSSHHSDASRTINIFLFKIPKCCHCTSHLRTAKKGLAHGHKGIPHNSLEGKLAVLS